MKRFLQHFARMKILKRLSGILLVLSTVGPVSAQRRSLPDYDGYRSLSFFAQDTVRYLQYNWGYGGRFDFTGTDLSDFFRVFELPIVDVEIGCACPGGVSDVGYIRFWLIPREEARRLSQTTGKTSNKYCLLVHSVMFDDFTQHSMLYNDLHPYIPELKRDGKTTVPWKDSYREALGPFLVGSILYGYNGD